MPVSLSRSRLAHHCAHRTRTPTYRRHTGLTKASCTSLPWQQCTTPDITVYYRGLDTIGIAHLQPRHTPRTTLCYTIRMTLREEWNERNGLYYDRLTTVVVDNLSCLYPFASSRFAYVCHMIILTDLRLVPGRLDYRVDNEIVHLERWGRNPGSSCVMAGGYKLFEQQRTYNDG